MKTLYNILVVALLIIGFAACSTKKNTWTSRAYHNVNAEFNVKFNANEAYKAGAKKADAYIPQEYGELPPVFSYEYKDVPGKVSGEMDRTIEKCEKLVTKHSITVKPKKPKGQMDKKELDFYNQQEFCAVVDDAYLLNGKANMYLHEYEKATALFDLILSDYPKSSAVPEAKIRLADILIRTNDLERAQRLLKESSANKMLPKKLNSLLDATYADFYIQKKDYVQAASYLEKALQKESKKANKIRYYFILAEMYAHSSKRAQAIDYLNKAIKLNPPYAATFAAQMRKAELYDPSAQKSTLHQELQSMLKDEKNAEYVDQIYFALAQVERASGRDSMAVDYLQKSMKAESSNDGKRATAYLQLGDYAYKQKEYSHAYDDYKSALDLLGDDDERYDTLSKKADALQSLAENYTIVKTEDSLQRIATMSPAEREKWINAQIAEVTAKEQQEQEEQKQSQYFRYQQDRGGATATGTDNAGKWYFYNTSSVNSGLSAFNMRWGKRKLEDDWRRKNKREVQSYTAQTTDAQTAAEQASGPPLSNKSPEYYTKNVPLTPEALAASNERLSGALFKLGEAYKDDVHEPLSAIGAFKRLDTQFPKNENIASTYFYLYQLYEETNRLDSSNYYKQLLIAGYPNSPLAQQLTNPNYFAEQQAKKTAMEAGYEKVFDAYQAGRYSEANSLAQQMIQQYPNSLLQPQLEFIRALCAGAGGDMVAYKAALTAITQQYPMTSIAKNATEIIAELEKKELSFEGTPADTAAPAAASTTTAATNYVLAEGTHYVGILCSREKNTAELLYTLESYNADTYLDLNLEVAVRDIGTNYSLVLVRSFESIMEAKEYRDALLKGETLKAYPAPDYRPVIISPDNLNLLELTKDVAVYLKFYSANY